MRFLAEGPSIPDELLVARDEGSVIFFCGAGVSLARSGLPNFLGLARAVINELGVGSEDDTRKQVELAREMESKTGITGLITADRIFGLLEREFPDHDIEAAVAKALRPRQDVDLSAHRVILELSRAPDGTIRLVTTNFDLLFEASDKNLSRWKPPNLPDPRSVDLEGIIHLHGHVNEDYSGAAGGGFVLSSSNFGRAYLSEGWATQFIREILAKYFIVFVGYTADDPPVQYLLEALNRGSGARNGIYAFQSGPSDYAESLWRHKGVRSIAYDETEGHRPLWETLSAWATRASNPESWQESVIDLARKGPAALLPHERGQVAHIVSTVEGARRFAAPHNPPPADWLCVFDGQERYATPGHIGRLGEDRTYFDPFDAFGLDSDFIPPRLDPSNYLASRNVPAGAWDCFSASRTDRQNLREDHFAAFRGHRAANVARLPSRLALLGDWMVNVSTQPVALWWTSGQISLHPEIRDRLRYEILRNAKCTAELRRAWRHVLNAQTSGKEKKNRQRVEVESLIERDGWTHAAVRELAESVRPYLKVERPRGTMLKPYVSDSEFSINELVSITVKYPDPPKEITIPDGFLVAAVREFRRNLEQAVSFEMEIGGWALNDIPPIETDPSLEGTSYRRTHGISGALFFYVRLFKELVKANATAAIHERSTWRSDEDAVFGRLRIWVCLERAVVPGFQVSQLVCGMTENVFWDARHQRDLLLVLKERWSDLTTEARLEMEGKLLHGPPPWNGVDEEYSQRRSISSLNRIHWLKSQGCEFSFDFDAKSTELRTFAPEWKPEYAIRAAASLEGTASGVRTDTDYTKLVTEPLATVLTKAKALSGRTTARFVENDPFAGLVTERPVRALSALSIEAKRKSYPEWAWRTFLSVAARKSDKPRFYALTAERLARLPQSTLNALVHPASEWLMIASKVLLQSFPDHFQRIWTALILTLKIKPDAAKSSILRSGREPDWAAEALNAPAGRLAQTLISDPLITGLKGGDGLPSSWISRADELLLLSEELRRHALVIFAHHLQWLFWIDPAWTDRTLLSAFEREGDDESAVWAGFFGVLGRLQLRNYMF